jgi:hypothetical protein
MAKYTVLVKSNDPDYMFFEDGCKAEMIGRYKTLWAANRAVERYVASMASPEAFNVKIYLSGINDKIEYDARQNLQYRIENLIFN